MNFHLNDPVYYIYKITFKNNGLSKVFNWLNVKIDVDSHVCVTFLFSHKIYEKSHRPPLP